MKSWMIGVAAAFACAGAALADGFDEAAFLAAFDKAVAERIYDPRTLQTEDWKAFRADFGRRLAGAGTGEAALPAFEAAWKGKPFSHFELHRTDATAAQATEALKASGANRDNAILTYPQPGTALLTVHTFLGDTVAQQIMAAMARVREERPRVLIVDLRDNAGGSMAGILLVQALLPKPADIGWFVNGRWFRDHDAAPNAAQIAAMKPLAQLHPNAFAADLADDGVSVVRLPGMAPAERPRVFVLISRRTASIAELASAALKTTGAATLVGERTAGQMLSGEFADVGMGFNLLLPTADYYSASEGRIEAVGVAPHVAAPADLALQKALELAARAAP